MSKAIPRSIWLTNVFAALLVFVAGCRTVDATPTPSPAEAAVDAVAMAEELVAAYPLAATAWDLDYFGPPDEPLPMLPDSRATVTFFWDRYAGFDGCNWFLGVYSANGRGRAPHDDPFEYAHHL